MVTVGRESPGRCYQQMLACGGAAHQQNKQRRDHVSRVGMREVE